MMIKHNTPNQPNDQPTTGGRQWECWTPRLQAPLQSIAAKEHCIVPGHHAEPRCPAPHLQGLRHVPVVQRDQGCDATGVELGQQGAVEVYARLVDGRGAAAAGDDAWPADGQPAEPGLCMCAGGRGGEEGPWRGASKAAGQWARRNAQAQVSTLHAVLGSSPHAPVHPCVASPLAGGPHERCSGQHAFAPSISPGWLASGRGASPRGGPPALQVGHMWPAAHARGGSELQLASQAHGSQRV
jgi:hypothetical protein